MINLRKVNLLLALNRFPFACICAVVASLVGMYVLDDRFPPASQINLILCGILGVLLFLNLKIASEAYGLNPATLWGGRLGILLILIISYFLLLPNHYEAFNTRLFRLPFQFGAVIIFLHLLVSYIPFLKQGSQEDFWEYNKDIFLRFVESGFFAAVLFIGLSIAIVALDRLFNLDIDDLVYPRLFFFLSGIFHTFYFLSKFPSVYHDNILKEPIKPFLVFSQYIILPLVGLYMAILYAYAAKIGVTWSLPKGWVSQLSLWFCVVGIFAYLLNYFTPRFADFKPVNFFKKYFFLILLLPIVLIFIAIWRRISEYGVTEARYVVALVGVWLLFVSLYYIISKEKNLKVIPISLSLFVLFAVFSGPVNIFNSTLKSQIPRFKANLENQNFLKDRALIALASTSTYPDSVYKFTNILRFMDERTDMSFINEWVDEKLDFVNEATDTDTIRSHQNAKVLADKLGIPFEINRYHSAPVEKGKQFSFGVKDFGESVQISEYQYFSRFQDDVLRRDNLPKQLSIKIDSTQRGLLVNFEDKLIDQIDLSTFIDSLTSSYDISKKHSFNAVPSKSFKYVHSSETSEVVLAFDNIVGIDYENSTIPKLRSISGNAIITLKQNDN